MSKSVFPAKETRPMYPAVLQLSHQERNSRLLLLLRPVLLVPLYIWGTVYAIASTFVYLTSCIVTLVTGRHPRALWNVLERYFVFITTYGAYTLLLTDTYPPFVASAAQREDVRVVVVYSAKISRFGVLLRPLLLLPHVLFTIGYSVVFFFCYVVTFATVLLLGRMTERQYGWMRGYLIYVSRVFAYALLLVNDYPPFNGAQPHAAAEMFGNAKMSM